MPLLAVLLGLTATAAFFAAPLRGITPRAAIFGSPMVTVRISGSLGLLLTRFWRFRRLIDDGFRFGFFFVAEQGRGGDCWVEFGFGGDLKLDRGVSLKIERFGRGG